MYNHITNCFCLGERRSYVDRALNVVGVCAWMAWIVPMPKKKVKPSVLQRSIVQNCEVLLISAGKKMQSSRSGGLGVSQI